MRVRSEVVSVVVALALAVVVLSHGVEGVSPIVQTTLGPVHGVVSGGRGYWLGVPFAASTGEENRFMPPQPREPWSEPFDATNWGPGCYQTHKNPDVPSVLSEDCLNVNFFSPASATSTSNLPVMIYLYGGGFTEGSNQGPFYMYNASYMVSHFPVVVASCNYRLGAFGWLVAGEEAVGNQGLLDQRACIEFVKANVAAFGGNPDQITLWGESAGAMSVGIHLLSPGSKGLFNRAIMESNPAGYRYRSLAESKHYGDNACTRLGCKDLLTSCNVTCMQHASAAAVGAAYSAAVQDKAVMAEANWGYWLEAALGCAPSVDGDIVPETVQAALAGGALNDNIDILTGTNNNEGSTFVYALFGKPMSEIEYDALMLGIFGLSTSSKIKAYYQADDTSDYRDVVSRIITDFWFRCASEHFAMASTAKGGNSYVYRYTHPNFSGAKLFELFGVPTVCEDRTCHMAELPFVFHFDHLSDPEFHMTPVEEELSDTMAAYWASFGNTGSPNNGPGAPTTAWPAWTSDRPNIVLADTLSTETSGSLCAFWDSIGYNF